MSIKKTVLWRWDDPTEIFEPTKSIFYKDIVLTSHDKCVRAGLNPLDWRQMTEGCGLALHKIVLNKQQAENCVVAEGCFIPTNEQLSELMKRRHSRSIGILRYYQDENYEKSFVPLLKYSGGYNLPEVLIPFSVKAKIISYHRILVLMWKLKMRIEKKIGLRKN